MSDWTCRVCLKRLTGFSTAHCTVCHLTFSTVNGFDMHRKGGECLPADALAEKGLREVRPGVLGRQVPEHLPTRYGVDAAATS